jgi:hypothetical protein
LLYIRSVLIEDVGFAIAAEDGPADQLYTKFVGAIIATCNEYDKAENLSLVEPVSHK